MLLFHKDVVCVCVNITYYKYSSSVCNNANSFEFFSNRHRLVYKQKLLLPVTGSNNFCNTKIVQASQLTAQKVAL